jgi:protein-disulfide isomerase
MITNLFRRVRAKWYGVLAGILLLGALGAIGAAAVRSSNTLADAAASDISSVRGDDQLHDPNSPVLGNPKGAVTVVEFFDYRCPYCRIMEPRLHELLTQDKSVRLVLKDWPIFGGVSVYAAQVAIAAGWQGKYAPVHDALFTLQRTMDRDAVRNAARKAGVDLAQLDRDLSARSAEIDRILGKTDVEARTLQLQGTPGFVIGHNLVPGALSLEDLEHLVAKAKHKK